MALYKSIGLMPIYWEPPITSWGALVIRGGGGSVKLNCDTDFVRSVSFKFSTLTLYFITFGYGYKESVKWIFYLWYIRNNISKKKWIKHYNERLNFLWDYINFKCLQGKTKWVKCKSRFFISSFNILMKREHFIWVFAHQCRLCHEYIHR